MHRRKKSIMNILNRKMCIREIQFRVKPTHTLGGVDLAFSTMISLQSRAKYKNVVDKDGLTGPLS